LVFIFICCNNRKEYSLFQKTNSYSYSNCVFRCSYYYNNNNDNNNNICEKIYLPLGSCRKISSRWLLNYSRLSLFLFFIFLNFFSIFLMGNFFITSYCRKFILGFGNNHKKEKRLKDKKHDKIKNVINFLFFQMENFTLPLFPISLDLILSSTKNL
jgi:hypothetical protein